MDHFNKRRKLLTQCSKIHIRRVNQSNYTINIHSTDDSSLTESDDEYDPHLHHIIIMILITLGN